jgi:hypothetical protein
MKIPLLGIGVKALAQAPTGRSQIEINSGNNLLMASGGEQFSNTALLPEPAISSIAGPSRRRQIR